MKTTLGTIICVFLISLLSCKDEEMATRIPYKYVEIDANLLNQEYIPLRNIGGYVYINGGHRGIILYKEASNKIRAFERLCPNDPEQDCAKVEVHSSGLYMIDNCCQSKYDFMGNPTGGPSRYPLREYYTSLANNFLYIRSDY